MSGPFVWRYRSSDGDALGESEESWFFDLPQGAWERQEAKNRELRQNVRQNIADAPGNGSRAGDPLSTLWARGNRSLTIDRIREATPSLIATKSRPMFPGDAVPTTIGSITNTRPVAEGVAGTGRASHWMLW